MCLTQTVSKSERASDNLGRRYGVGRMLRRSLPASRTAFTYRLAGSVPARLGQINRLSGDWTDAFRRRRPNGMKSPLLPEPGQRFLALYLKPPNRSSYFPLN